MGIDEDAFLKTMQAHLEASYECRWCFGIDGVFCIEGTMAARVPNRLFPEYAREGYEEQTVLEMWFPGVTR